MKRCTSHPSPPKKQSAIFTHPPTPRTFGFPEVIEQRHGVHHGFVLVQQGLLRHGDAVLALHEGLHQFHRLPQLEVGLPLAAVGQLEDDQQRVLAHVAFLLLVPGVRRVATVQVQPDRPVRAASPSPAGILGVGGQLVPFVLPHRHDPLVVVIVVVVAVAVATGILRVRG